MISRAHKFPIGFAVVNSVGESIYDPSYMDIILEMVEYDKWKGERIVKEVAF